MISVISTVISTVISDIYCDIYYIIFTVYIIKNILNNKAPGGEIPLKILKQSRFTYKMLTA